MTAYGSSFTTAGVGRAATRLNPGLVHAADRPRDSVEHDQGDSDLFGEGACLVVEPLGSERHGKAAGDRRCAGELANRRYADHLGSAVHPSHLAVGFEVVAEGRVDGALPPRRNE